MARLKVKYTEEVAPALFKKFGYKSTMQIPKIDKVVVNVGCGEARENAKILEADRKSTRLNSSHDRQSRMPSSA